MKKIECLEEHKTLILSRVAQGMSEREAVADLPFSHTTFRRLLATDKEFKDQISQCREINNRNVEASLLQCCNGYTYIEDIANKVKKEVLSEDGKTILVQESIEIVKVKKHVKKDVNAIKFWLLNQSKKNWNNDPNKLALDKKMVKLKEREIANKEF